VMFSIIFSSVWLLALKKSQNVTIDGVYIALPILADAYIIVELLKCLTH
jgi:hypothetical protein